MAQRGRNLIALDQDYVVDAAELPTGLLQPGCCLSWRVRPFRSLIPVVNHLGIFRFIAAHNLSRVLHYLSLFIIVFSGKNSQQVFTIPERGRHWVFVFSCRWLNSYLLFCGWMRMCQSHGVSFWLWGQLINLCFISCNVVDLKLGIIFNDTAQFVRLRSLVRWMENDTNMAASLPDIPIHAVDTELLRAGRM
jgi:hypothetical protein